MLKILLTYFCLILLFILLDAIRNEVRCGKVDIRNTPRMAFQPRSFSTIQYHNDSLSYKECTIIEGDITIALITQANHTHDEYPVFENLREVTGAILIFQIRGLLSLGGMFPNLRVIGGNPLIMNYALVIYQNQDLRQVGLTKLSVIKNGGVRITENPKLCFAKNINWDSILVGKVRDLIVDQVPGHCNDDCVVENEEMCHRDRKGKLACWNQSNCQRVCKTTYDFLSNNTSGCTDEGLPCHNLCIGGCFKGNDPGSCFTCRYFDVNGVCSERCPSDYYEHLGRRCLTRAECVGLYPIILTTSLGKDEKSYWKAFNGTCHYECLNNYQEDPNDWHNCVKCKGYCPKKCSGNIVDSIGSALKFSKCNMIEGNLELDMRIRMESTSGERFTEAFGEIEEITGYLLIRFSTAFMSLHMFKKLRIIHGETLWKNMYALVVFENQNLRQLFQQPLIEIRRGKVSFQNNRMLCYKTIDAFVRNVGLRNNVSDSDISPISNGDKAICDEIPLEIKIDSVYSYGFVVSWTPFNTSDMDHRKFLGYQIFYKKVDKVDAKMNIDDDRSACSDSWTMLFVTDGADIDISGDETSFNSPKGEIINQGIEANSLYAVYVQTRLVNHPGALNGISKIHFVQTLFAVPDPPRMNPIKSVALDSNTIIIQWDPPLNPLGVITHYTVVWSLEKPTRPSGNPCEISPRIRTKPSNSVSVSSSDSATCSRDQGCCKCDNASINNQSKLISNDAIYTNSNKDGNGVHNELDDTNSEDKTTFENTIQNFVFVQNCEVSNDPQYCPNAFQTTIQNEIQRFQRQLNHHKRRKKIEKHHHLSRYKHFYAILRALRRKKMMQSEQKSFENATSKIKKAKRSVKFSKNLKNKTLNPDVNFYDDNFTSLLLNNSTFSNEIFESLPINYSHLLNVDFQTFDVNNLDKENNATYGKVNVTKNGIILSGLLHFSEYQIMVFSCQDETATEHYCSTRPGWVSVHTIPIEGNDEIDPSSIVLLNVTDGKPNDRRIYWLPPFNPNGLILNYRAKLLRNDESTPIEQCIPYFDFEKNNGVVFSGIPSGRYRLEIRVETTTGLQNNVIIIENIFEINAPTFFTAMNIAIIVGALLVTLVGLAVLCFFYANERINGKVEEFYTQNMSANPEYLSQFEVYKADDWELKRSDINIMQKIGQGTFGMVMRGFGNNVLSKAGVKFGDCAVKTIPGSTDCSNRCHFLLEANVMKRFNTEFIVKLYGVVSDGVPVLVVMELMEKGNLRDFLRSHRPGAEENVKKLPLPTLTQYFTWAAQIADGMSYLENEAFCHRDLAARNCMVHADETVKIGDFGMARDIYYQEYYRPAGRRMMPVRWMAPESLKDGKFTSKSDVWSYGIVLYEMLTLGEQPYAGLANEEVFHHVVVDRRVSRKPQHCHQFWYSIMQATWQYDPRDRPLFQQIVNHIKSFTTQQFQSLSFVINDLPKVGKIVDDYDFKAIMNNENRKRQSNCQNQNYYREQEFPSNPLRRSRRNNVEKDHEDEQCESDEGSEDISFKNKKISTLITVPTTGINYSAAEQDKKISIADKAIQKAKLIGVPFKKRRRNRRFNNHNSVDKWIVLETLFGFNPNNWGWGKKSARDLKETVNEAYGSLPAYPANAFISTVLDINDDNILSENEDHSDINDSCHNRSINDINSLLKVERVSELEKQELVSNMQSLSLVDSNTPMKQSFTLQNSEKSV